MGDVGTDESRSASAIGGTPISFHLDMLSEWGIEAWRALPPCFPHAQFDGLLTSKAERLFRLSDQHDSRGAACEQDGSLRESL